MERNDFELHLPGFRFHPTEAELLDFYLRRVVQGEKLDFDFIGSLNIYHYDPWELPGLAKVGEREWYFFVPRDRKSGNRGRANRTTERGFWKATGCDRQIRSLADSKHLLGLKKTLVFYQGRARRGTKTDWIMNEYRLPDSYSAAISTPQQVIVLCKIYRKATSMKELEQRAASEEKRKEAQICSAMADNVSIFSAPSECMDVKEMEAPKKVEVTSTTFRSVKLPELQIPMDSLDWMQDPFLTQLRSPWLDQWSPCANILYF
ncbi:unnamed protein product [Musa acuminata subsp. burmannicoides]